MKNILVSSLVCIAVAAVAGAYELGRSSSGAAQDPTKLSPEVYKVLFDNDRVRVLDVTLKAGAKSPMHGHPDHVVYALSDGKARFTSKDGKSLDVELKKGQCVWNDALSHGAENAGETEIRVLNIELKEPKPEKKK